MTREKFLEISEYIGNVIKHSKFDGHVFIVGGSVRDFVMGNDPKDIDICVDLPSGGIEFAEWIRDNQGLTKTVVTYPTYGTAMFKFHKYPDDEIECVMTRKEQYKDKNSRNPSCCHGNIFEDSIRRDLTINALYMKPDGTILDPTGKGLDDIQNQIIRVTNDEPDTVFIDDPLRICRVIRFSTRYGWNINPDTCQAMIRNVDRLSIITKERIRDEFEKILLSEYAVSGLTMLKHIGAMKYIIPELEETYELEQNAFHFGTVFQHTIALIEHYHEKFEPDVVCLLACLLHDIGKIKTKSVGYDGRIHFYEHENETQLVEDILRRLKYDNNTIKEVCFLVRNHMRTKNFGDDCEKIKPKHLNKLVYTCKTPERFTRLVKVIECDNLSHHPLHCIRGQYKFFMEQLDNPMFNYKLPVSGDDVMEILGIEPGPVVKVVLDKLVKHVFSNQNLTREQLLKQVPHIFKQINREIK